MRRHPSYRCHIGFGPRLTLLAWASITAPAVTACGDAAGPVPAVASISIAPADTALGVGKTLQLQGREVAMDYGMVGYRDPDEETWE